MKIVEQLKELGYEKPRTAVALLPLAFFAIIYLFAALSAEPAWRGAFIGLSACYLTAFLALGSEAFWARWFASGLGWSGMMVGIAALFMVGWNPALAIYGGLHAIVVVMLLGPKMAARFDMQPGWRERYAMDEFGVIRLRKAVTRAAAALPSLIIWALGPREGDGRMLVAVAAVLAVLGLHGVVRLRTVGILALAGASVAMLFAGPIAPFAAIPAPLGVLDPMSIAMASGGAPGAIALLLGAAALPFAGAMVRFLRTAR
jgi:hypothetical protein